MRLGLFGGTFDPVHAGHLDVAHAARQQLSLDAVWLIPAHVPPHRREPHASAAHRFAMVSLAVQDQEGLIASDLEMEVPGPSYTVDTLNRLEDRGIDIRLVFLILGADAFRDIASWKDYPAVLDRCHFVVVSRPGFPASSTRAAFPALRDRMRETPCDVPPEPSILLVDAATSPVSSTDIRAARSRGEALRGSVPAAVAAHITRHGLYARRAAPEN
jgi:nicotinate-nucleotide adenylyltransferase